MKSIAATNTLQLEPYRSYLRLLARINVGQRLKGKVDASDIVQQTLLKAHVARHEFQGADSTALTAWLRKILVRTISDAVRDLHRGKRDAGLERSLEGGIEQSSCRLGEWLAAEQLSPSGQAMRGELFLQLFDALEELPEAQREAIVLKHCDDLTLDEVSRRLNRSPASVASLLRRGLKQLREQLNALESPNA